jgi:hypothetical protein
MTMSELSPAARAVLDAASDVYWDWGGVPSDPHTIAAAALRAAADEVCLRWSELQHPADVLNAIADELETQ